MPYDTLLLDFDGVLRRWPNSDEAVERAHGLLPGTIRRAAFAPESLRPAILGACSDSCWRDGIAARLARDYPDSAAAAAVAQWSAPVGVLDSAILALLDACVPVMRLVLVSNATSRLSADLAALGLARRFHAVVNSSAVGVAKPDPRIYRAALQAAGTVAARTLYVDDELANVEAARQLGIHAHHYLGPAPFADFLQAAGALRGSTGVTGGRQTG